MWVFPCEQRVAGWGTNSRSGMCVGESSSLSGQAVDVWSFHLRRAVASDIAIPKIIGKDKHDVRALVRQYNSGSQDDLNQKASCEFAHFSPREFLQFHH